MKTKTLLFLSLVISSMTILYLLIASIYRESFVPSDWIVVSVDLVAKVVIEIYILFGRKVNKNNNY